MAAPTRRLIALGLLVTLTVWVLGSVLFVLRWNSIVRPDPPRRSAFPYGEMRVGVDASYPPFAVNVNGHLSGIDIDLALALGEELEIPVRFVTLGYDGLYDALRTDQVDVLISALLVDPSRGGLVLYSQPYFDAGLVLVSDPQSPVNEMRDLSGYRLAIEFGSQGQTEADRWLRRIQPFELLPYELPQIALDSARLGEADAALVDNIAARLYLRTHSAWNPHVTQVTSAPFALATRADQRERIAALSEALETLAENGTLGDIIRRYL